LQLAKAVEKAIKTSPLSLNAVTEGSEVLVKLPRMTQETIDRMVKLVHMEAEGAHQGIRRARQKGMDAVKKAFKSASQDEKKRQEKEVRGLWLSSRMDMGTVPHF
jgi:ribosome recycling factor